MFKSVSSKVDFPVLEKEVLKYWQEKGIVGKYLHRNDKSEKQFSFLDGPITANGPMGVHHAWGRTYKDLWQRFWNMRGYKQRFQNGFDCQGLWVEVEVEKELGIRSKKEIENLVAGDKKASIAKFVELCKDRVYKYSAMQTEQSKRLAYFMDWDNSYYTMSDENNYMIWHFLKICHEKGWIYKGLDSVPWCPRCETAISQHEMLTEDYKLVTHKSIYLELPLEGRENECLLIWTTTPWTIPANIAVAVDEALDYSLVEGEKGYKFWVAKDAVDRIFGNDKKSILKIVKGKELVGLRYRGPFDELSAVKKVAFENEKTFHTVIATDTMILPISVEDGTGLVHTAVSAGIEDFKLGKLRNLPMIPVIDDTATYLEGLGFLTGQNAKKHPEVILDFLTNEDSKGNNWVFKIEDYTHRYPACWRCKTELVWKATEEWYIAMDKADRTDKQNRNLRKMMMDVARKIRWMPEWGLDRELDWLKNMHDWLISKKNRYWGLALPIYECQKCGNFEVIGSKAELEEKAVSGWNLFKDRSPHKPYIDEVKIKCLNCNSAVSRIDDVGNVWLDAGIVPFSTYVDPKTGKLSYTTDKLYWREWFPADFITESFPGQFKNWFYSLIAMSTAIEKTNPFKTVLGYASVLGEDGRPMHKSWGNAINFNEGADKIGVDVMRWMYVTQEPEQNLLFGYKKADETRRRFHLMFWNIYNFFITYANIDGWETKKINSDLIEIENVLDQWIISKLNETIKAVTEFIELYDVRNASLNLQQFVSDLSLWYVRRSRDRVGPTVENTKDKDICYQTLFEVLTKVSKLLAPFTPFLAEEIYKNLTGEDSVHLSQWPMFDKKLINKKSEKNMEEVRKLAELGHAKRKEKGIRVRQPLSKFKILNYKFKINEELEQLLKDELNVKKIKFEKGGGETVVDFDIKLTPELIAEGQAREIVRKIQEERKKLETQLDQKVNVILPDWPKEFEDYIRKEAMVRAFEKGDGFSIKK